MSTATSNADTHLGAMWAVSDFRRGILERALKPLEAISGIIAAKLLGPIVSSLQDCISLAPMQAAFTRFNRLQRAYPKAFSFALTEKKGEMKALEQKLEQGFNYETLTSRELQLAIFVGIDQNLQWLVHGVVLELLRRQAMTFVMLLKMLAVDDHAQQLKVALEKFIKEPARAPPPRLPLKHCPQTQTNAPSFLA